MRVLAPCLLVVATLGCDVLLSTDDYSTAKVEAARLGSIYTAECRSCLDSECSELLADCDRDEECRSLLGCLETCRDPGCVQRCAAPNYGPSSNAWPVENLEDCLVKRCWDSCPIGRDFGCRDYSWPAVYTVDQVVALDVKVFNLLGGLTAGVAGIEVTPCITNSFSDSCNSDFTETTDKSGFVTLEVPMSVDGFRGALQGIDPEDPAITYRTYRDLPFNHYWDVNYVAVDDSGAGRAFFEGQTGKTYDDSVGGLQLELFDCNTWPAGGVVLTEPVASDDYWVYYPSGKGRTVGEGERDDEGVIIDGNLNFVFVVGPPGEIDVELRTTEGALYRRTRLTLHPARLDTHTLYPQAQ